MQKIQAVFYKGKTFSGVYLRVVGLQSVKCKVLKNKMHRVNELGNWFSCSVNQSVSFLLLIGTHNARRKKCFIWNYCGIFAISIKELRSSSGDIFFSCWVWGQRYNLTIKHPVQFLVRETFSVKTTLGSVSFIFWLFSGSTSTWSAMVYPNDLVYWLTVQDSSDKFYMHKIKFLFQPFS